MPGLGACSNIDGSSESINVCAAPSRPLPSRFINIAVPVSFFQRESARADLTGAAGRAGRAAGPGAVVHRRIIILNQ